MTKDILFLATVPSMIVAFNSRNIRILQDMGYTIHAACNFKDRSAWTDEQIADMEEKLREMKVDMHQIDMPRKPYHPIQLIKSYRQIKKLAREHSFCLLHNQSCVSGIVGRIALRKKIPKIMHTEHGFYYFEGGPAINWIFYPFDKLCSRWTDELVVINHDDFEFAKSRLKAKHVTYIPGVGIDTEYYCNTVINRAKKRAQFGIPEDAFVVLSVGELNENKNHEVIIKAIATLKNQDIYYVICGEGTERDKLISLAGEHGLSERVILTGQRKDVNEFIKMADVFAFPSKREGLGLAALEAMAGGLPLISSNRNGINDYAENGKTGFMCEPDDVNGFANAIDKIQGNHLLSKQFSDYNLNKVGLFSEKSTDKIMGDTYAKILLGNGKA